MHELGNYCKQAIRPFLPGEEHLWQKQISCLRGLYQWVQKKPEWLSECILILKKAPSILEILQILKNESTLQVSHLFQLKQWLVCGQELSALWKCSKDDSESGTADDDSVILQQASWKVWLRIIQPFGTLTTTFAWSDLQDPVLQELSRNRVKKEQGLAQIKIQQAKLVAEKTGLRPDRQRQVLLQKPMFDPGQAETYEKQKQSCLNCGLLHFKWESNSEICFTMVDTIELQQIQAALDQLHSESLLRQQFLLQLISRAFLKEIHNLFDAANAIGKLDYYLAVIRLALPWQEMCWGEIVSSAPEASSCFEINMYNAVHPVYRLQHETIEPGYKWTAIDLALSKVNVITGPNMGGKSAALHTIALLQALFQHGLPLPSRSYSAPFCSWIRYHGGDDSNAGKGISSFAAEMIRLSEILLLPGKGLVLFDELARSTNPDEGEALAIAVIETAFERNSITVCATHFPRVRLIPHISLFQVKGLLLLEQEPVAINTTDNMDALLHYLHQHMSYELIPVTSREIPQYAFSIAARLGLPAPILARGRKYLGGKEGC